MSTGHNADQGAGSNDGAYSLGDLRWKGGEPAEIFNGTEFVPVVGPRDLLDGATGRWTQMIDQGVGDPAPPAPGNVTWDDVHNIRRAAVEVEREWGGSIISIPLALALLDLADRLSLSLSPQPAGARERIHSPLVEGDYRVIPAQEEGGWSEEVLLFRGGSWHLDAGCEPWKRAPDDRR